MGKITTYSYQDKHDQIIHDDKQTVYCSLVNNRYTVQSTSGEIKIHCPGCGEYLILEEEKSKRN